MSKYRVIITRRGSLEYQVRVYNELKTRIGLNISFTKRGARRLAKRMIKRYIKEMQEDAEVADYEVEL